MSIVDQTFIDELLRLPTLAAQVAYLQTADLCHHPGLQQLLGQATKLARTDPGQARQVAALCAQTAVPAQAPLIIPQAYYIQAQTHAANGELDTALTLIQAAHQAYTNLGETLPALRTHVGRMHVLNELGHHQEVLSVAQTILTCLAQNPHFDPTEARHIATFTHNNVGICYRRMGRYEEALDAYAQAERLANQMPEHLGDIQNNQGGILMHLGRVSEALKAYEASAAAHAQAGQTWRHAIALNNIGEAHLLLGNYTQSLAALDKAQHQLGSLDALADEQIGLLYRADVYLALNLFPEALAAYRDADHAFQQTRMIHYRARALWGLGATLITQSQFAEANVALSTAVQLFTAAGNVPMSASVMLEQAALHQAQGEPEAAVAIALQADGLIDAAKWPVQQLYVHLRLADLLRHDLAAVEAHLLAAQHLSDELMLPHLRYRLYQRLGQLRWQQGQLPQAQVLLTTAVEEIEQLRGTVAQEAMRVSFIHDKITAYESLLQIHLAQAQWWPAFMVAEQAKSRTLVDLLTGIIDGNQATVPPSQHSQRLQMLQADLNAIYNTFLNSTQETSATLQPRAQQLEQEIKQLSLQQAPSIPAVNPFTTALPLETFPRHLPADVTIVAYHMIGADILAFIYQNGVLHTRQKITTVAPVQAQLQHLAIQWERFQVGQTFTHRHQALLERSTQRILLNLYTHLIAPIADLLPAKDAAPPPPLAIIPHGLLHRVPFHALYDGQDYLLDHYEISYAPSTTIFALYQQKPRLSPQKALVLGVSDPLIPSVKTEVAAITKQLPDCHTFVDETATVQTLTAQASRSDLIHLACHGLFRADNPIFSALKLYDGWLTAVDILPLQLNNALVTLSACESGRSAIFTGDEIIGLARAFLGAGASTLVVSLWLVHDDTTATLMADWYTNLQQGSYSNRAAALRAAQLTLKARYPHPYYWAPFILIGQR